MERDEFDGGLGELPATLRDERGETFPREARKQGESGGYVTVSGQAPQDARGDGGGFPPPPPQYQGDVERQSQIDTFGLPGVRPLAPPQDFDVTVTYPAQPVNSDGLVFEAIAYLDVPGDAFSQLQDVASFAVPEGNIAVVREVEWFPIVEVSEPGLSAAIQLVDPPDYAYDFFAFRTVPVRNGIVQGEPSTRVSGVDDATGNKRVLDLPFWTAQRSRRPVYILGQPRDEIGLQFTTTANNAGGSLYVTNIMVRFYGELLISRGRPLPFEPSNRSA